VAVFADFRFDTRPYSGYDDPSLPIGAWIASGAATGNATGGSLFMLFLCQIAETTRVTELFNLEQVAIHADVAATIPAVLRTEQMDVLNPNVRATEVQEWLLLLTSAGSADSALQFIGGNQLPIWLGAPTDGDVDAGIQLEFPNVDLRVHHATIQGYMWGPRSIIAPGGPQRPPNGLYGR